MAKKKSWIITASQDRPIADITKDLADARFAVSQVLGEVGCIIGSAADEDVSKLRTIPGIIDVSPDIGVQVGPPDSPSTW